MADAMPGDPLAHRGGIGRVELEAHPVAADERRIDRGAGCRVGGGGRADRHANTSAAGEVVRAAICAATIASRKRSQMPVPAIALNTSVSDSPLTPVPAG